MLTPETEDDLAALVAEGATPFRVFGGDTRPLGAPVNAAPLSTRAMSGIGLYDPGALTMVVRAGTPLAEVETALAAEGQRLAFEPMDHRGLLGTEGTPTIGGVVGANVSGPRRIQAGACRDFVLGVRFVDGRGQVIKNGGRVMKNVTGYDLVKLMAGSYGTLGIMTELSLKVLPDTQITNLVTLRGLDDATAIKALSRALASPCDVTGAAHLQKGEAGAPVTMIRIEGFANSVSYRAGELRKLLAGYGEVTLDNDDESARAAWASVRDVASFHGRPGDVWRVSTKPTDGPGIVARLQDVEAIYDWGGGLVWLLVPEGSQQQTIRRAVSELGGHAMLVRGDRASGAFQPLAGPVAALQEGLRHRFDPRGLFNPGLMTAMDAA